MIFDKNLFFFGSSPYASVSNYQSVAGVTTASTTLTSGTVDLGVAEDLGIGDGEAIPKLAAYIGTGITSACTGLRLNFQFQGSTDSSNWTTYIESGALASTTLIAGANVMPWDWPKRPAGAALARYYRVNVVETGVGGAESISTGSILVGVVVQRADAADTLVQYSSGFTVAS